MSNRLDIINAMLRITGEFSVDSELENHPDVVTCKAILDSRRREELGAGLWFNIVTMTLFRSPAGEILYSADNVLALDATNVYTNVSLRNGKLYDNDNNTFIFAEDIEVEMIIDMSEEEIPPLALAYIKWLSVLEYAGIQQITGEPIKAAQTSLQRAEKLYSAEKFRKADVSFNDNPLAQRMFAFRRKFSTTRQNNYNGTSGSKLRKL